MTSYHKQFQVCNRNGTCQHMSRENHDKMPLSEQEKYARDRLFFCYPREFYGPKGPLFCGFTPGICDSEHCPLTNLTPCPQSPPA